MPTITRTPYTSPYPSTIIALHTDETFRHRAKTITTITITPPQWGPLSPLDGHQDLLCPAGFQLQGKTASGRLYTNPDVYLIGDIPEILPSHLQGLTRRILTEYISSPPPRLPHHAANGLTPRPPSLLQRATKAGRRLGEGHWSS